MTNKEFDEKFNQIYENLVNVTNNKQMIDFAFGYYGQNPRTALALTDWFFGFDLDEFIEWINGKEY